VLPLIIGSEKDRLSLVAVVAFGTATTPGDTSFNGSVMLGTEVFIHDPYATRPNDSPSKWSMPDMMDTRIPSSFPVEAFRALSRFTGPVSDINLRLLAPPGNPAATRELIYEPSGIAVSSVNVVDSKAASSKFPL
jgi:hypothetical protein